MRGCAENDAPSFIYQSLDFPSRGFDISQSFMTLGISRL